MRCLLAFLLIFLSGSAFAQAGRFQPVLDSSGRQIGYADSWKGGEITLTRAAYAPVADAGVASSATSPLLESGQLGWINNANGEVALRGAETYGMDAGLVAPVAETVATDVAVGLPELAAAGAEACWAGPLACLADIAATALIARDVYYDTQQQKWMKNGQAGPQPPPGCTGDCAGGEFFVLQSSPGGIYRSPAEGFDAWWGSFTCPAGDSCSQGSPESAGSCGGDASSDCVYYRDQGDDCTVNGNCGHPVGQGYMGICKPGYYANMNIPACVQIPECPGQGETFNKIDGQCYAPGLPVPATKEDIQNALQNDVPQGAPSRQLAVDLTNSGDPIQLSSNDPVTMTPTEPVQTINGPTTTSTDPSGHTLTTNSSTTATLGCTSGSISSAGCSLSTTQTTTTCDAANNCTTTSTTQGQTQSQPAHQDCGLGGQAPCNVKVIDDSKAPTLGDAKTFQQSTEDFMTSIQGAPLVAAFSGIAMPTGGSCPTYTYNVPYINFYGVMNAQCVIAEEIRTPLRIIMLAIFGLWAVRVFLEA